MSRDAWNSFSVPRMCVRSSSQLTAHSLVPFGAGTSNRPVAISISNKYRVRIIPCFH